MLRSLPTRGCEGFLFAVAKEWISAAYWDRLAGLVLGFCWETCSISPAGWIVRVVQALKTGQSGRIYQCQCLRLDYEQLKMTKGSQCDTEQIFSFLLIEGGVAHG